MGVAGTLFNYKDIHKMTWRLPDGQIFNQIDHLLIVTKHVSNVMDVRTFRGANIDSDPSIYGATVPSGPWPPSQDASIHLYSQLFSSILLSPAVIVHPSEPHPPI